MNHQTKFGRLIAYFIFIILILSSQIFATTYYVDIANGNDSSSGTSPTTAWRTIAKVNKASFAPGDYILFKCGEVWREQLLIPSPGSPGNPITFGAYGSGDNPLILGSDDYDDPSKWMSIGSNKWATASGSFTSKVNMIWYDTDSSPKLGIAVSNESDLNTNWEFWYDAINNRVVLYHDGGNPADQTNGLEIGKRIICIGSGSSRSYITIEGIDVKFANWDGIRFIQTPIAITIKNLNANYNGQRGIYTENASNVQIDNVIMNHNYYGIFLRLVSPGTIQNCSIEYNEDHGICLTGSHNITVQNNMIGYNGKSGVGGDQFYNSIFQDNRIYDNEWGGIDLTSSTINCHDNIVRRNIFYNHQAQTWIGAVHMWANDTPGYETYNNKVYYNIFYNNKEAIHIDGRSHDNEIYNNTIYDCVKGIDILSSQTAVPTDNTIKNNIIFNCSETLIRDETGESTNTLDYNCYYSNGTNKYKWSYTYYDTLSEFQTVSNQDSNSYEQDPLLGNPAAHDFHLQYSSPCIDTGTNVKLTEDFERNYVPQGSAPDIGALEYYDYINFKLLNLKTVNILELCLIFLMITLGITAYLKRR